MKKVLNFVYKKHEKNKWRLRKKILKIPKEETKMVKTIVKVVAGVATMVVGGMFAISEFIGKEDVAEVIENAAEGMEEVAEEIAEGDIAAE